MRRDEDGAIAIVVTLTLVMLLGFASFAIDLAQLRVDRAAGQSAADMAAAAAALAYDPGAADGAYAACEQAIAYAEENLDVTLTASHSCAAAWQSQPPCTADQATYAGAPFTVTVTIPVPDGDPLMGSQMLVPEYDGAACDRVGVKVDRDRTLLFAAAGQVGDNDSGTQMSAVGRYTATGDDGDYASLIVLHPNSCLALHAKGAGPQQVGVRVSGFTDPVTGEYYPGVITVDSLRDTCTNPNQIIRTDGGGEIFAKDHILSYQLLAGTNDAAAWANNVHTDVAPNVPEPGKRVTRAPVDHEVNCLASYPTDQLWSPAHASSLSSAGPCDDAGSEPPYIKTLHARYQDLTFADQAAANAAGWNYLAGAGCGGTGTYGPATKQGTTDGRRWFLDCPGTSGNSGFTPTDVAFDGVDAVVTRGQIRLQNDALRVSGSSDRGAVLYVQAGSIQTGSATLDFDDTFVYIQNGVLDIASAVLSWIAPYAATLEASCTTYDNAFVYASDVNAAPPASCFAPLALWTNSAGGHKLGGGGSTLVEGSFFTPNAQPFNVQGGAGSNYTKAQFFAGTMLFGGSGKVDMAPNPDTNIAIPLTGGGLIR